MGTSGRVTHGALHSPLLLVFMTVALLAGSSCSHRVLSQIPPLTTLTISVKNNLAIPVVVTVSSESFRKSFTVSPGQDVQISLNNFQALNGFVGPYTIAVAVGGEVYVFVPTLVQEISGDLAGVSLTLSVCANLQPGLSFTVSVADKPPTTICIPPPTSSPPPPTFSPPPPSPSPPPPSPSSPPPSPSPPPPSPSPPPPSPSPPPPSPSPPPPSPSPPPPSPSPPPPSPPPPTPEGPPPPPCPSPPPPSPPPPTPEGPPPPPSPPPPTPEGPPPPPVSSPPPPPINVIVLLGFNVTNTLPVSLTISLTETTGGVTFVISAVITPGGSQLITLQAGSPIVSATITTTKIFHLPSKLLQTLLGIVSSTGDAQLQVSTCPGGILVTVAASVPDLRSAPGVCLTD